MTQKPCFQTRITEKVGAVFVGNSGSGKSTLARHLGYLGVGHGYLGTGDLLRKEEAKNKAFANIVSSYTSTGDHVPNGVLMPYIRSWFTPLAKHRLVIFDGFPRNISQVDEAFHLLHEHGFLKVVTLFVNTPADVCAHRLIMQAQEAEQNGIARNDTDEVAMALRLKAFNDKVKPTLDILRDRSSKFVEIDTTRTSLTDLLEVRDVAIEGELIYPIDC